MHCIHVTIGNIDANLMQLQYRMHLHSKTQQETAARKNTGQLNVQKQTCQFIFKL